MTPLAYVNHEFASTNVDDTAFVQLTLTNQGGASLTSCPGMISKVHVNYDGGSPMVIGVGQTIADAVIQYMMGPNERGEIDLPLSEGHKLFVKCAKAGTTVNTGVLTMTLFHGRR